MMDIMQGQSSKIASNECLIDFFKNSEYNGKLYTGYPILYSGGDNITLDAIWISPKGIIVFDIIEGPNVDDRSNYRDNLYNKIEATLKQYSKLSKGRNLLVRHEVITYAPACTNVCDLDCTANNDNLNSVISDITEEWADCTEAVYKLIISVIQSIVQLKAPAPRATKTANSRGAIMNNLEETIANLDNQQEKAIIEYKDGIQRIRGLAGSGKTIVLALKAAYLHSVNPDWDIAITFNTRSLKDQFKDLIELFCIQRMGQKPNYEKIKIIHAWGGSSSPGIYYDFCKDNNIVYSDFRDAKIKSASAGKLPFDYICELAVSETKGKSVCEKYDLILVDEAQDLSASFLNLCYKTLKGSNKRLVYAYDELQKLHEGSSLPNPKSIFSPRIKFDDIILNRCYRNPKQALAVAHALGFGIYRNTGLVQFFDEPKLWKDLGYNTIVGNLRTGDNVTLAREDNAAHQQLNQYSDSNDIIKFIACEDKMDQAKRVVADIIKNLNEEDLSCKDIIVINPASLTTKDEVAIIRKLLYERGINSHIAGDVNKDKFFIDSSIAFTGINRAKGNEVPMVYIINAQYCYAGANPQFPNRGLQEKRNVLFTAITRSKAWVRVYGGGQHMKLLTEEFQKVVDNDYTLKFTYPSKDEIKKINLISRDITDDETNKLSKEIELFNGINEIIDGIKRGDAFIEDYPDNMHPIITALLTNGN